MYVKTKVRFVWVSDEAPHWKDWYGRQAYRYIIAEKARKAAS